MEIILVFAVFFLPAVGLFALGLTWGRINRGFRNGHTAATCGKLSFYELHRNVALNKADTHHGDRTYFTYSYEVGGVTYTTRKKVTDLRPKRLPSSTNVIYQIRNPRHSYLPEFECCPYPSDHSILYIVSIAMALVGLSILP